jgi:putative endonuclease
MRPQCESANPSVRRGAWGEEVAAELLRRKGYLIVARNFRPDPRDRRLELDIVAYDRQAGAIVFVEVKQHARHETGEARCRGVDRRKLRNMRRACTAWRLGNNWQGGFRFDVVEVYGVPGDGAPEIDHIERVALFVDRCRQVDWT